MGSIYKLVYWDIQVGRGGASGDIGAPVRVQLAKAALTLQDEPDVLLASAAGGYISSIPPELALLVPADTDPSALRPAVIRAVRAGDGLVEAKVDLKHDVHYYSFSDETLEAIQEAANVQDSEDAGGDIDAPVNITPTEDTSTFSPKTAYSQHNTRIERLIDELNAAKLRDLETPTAPDVPGKTDGTNIDDHPIPQNQRLPQIAVSEIKYMRMKAATREPETNKGYGAAIDVEVKTLQDGIKKLAALATNPESIRSPNQFALIMVEAGLVSVGHEMWKEYVKIQKAPSMMQLLVALVQTVGPLEVVRAAQAIADKLIVIEDVKDSYWNNLVFVNGRSTALTLLKDFVLNGVRDGATITIEGCSPPDTRGKKPLAFPSGFFFYDAGYSIQHSQDASHGSTVGLAFQSSGRDNPNFSLGMSCLKHTWINGNSVGAINGDNLEKLAHDIERGQTNRVKIKVGKVTCVIAEARKYLNPNRCIAWIGA